MNSIEFDQLLAVLSAGLGMLLIGGLNLLLPRSLPWRATAFLLVTATLIGALLAFSVQMQASVLAAGILMLAVVACILAGTSYPTSFAALLGRLGRHPEVRWALFACAGLATAIGSILAYERAEKVTVDQFSAELAQLSEVPPGQAIASVQVLTDRGNPILVREALDPRHENLLTALEERVLSREPARGQVIRRQPADDRTNCHGWVFTGGRYWVGGTSVEQVLLDNGYQPVDPPQPGDLAIYRDRDNNISHTAIVRYVTGGMPVMVEGKWGCTGIFIHPVDASLYGANYTFYRSQRPGHLLIGLGGPSPDPGPAPSQPK